jgi:signal transduction histidine kinase
VSRFKDGRFTTFTTADGLASNTVVSIVDAADGTMWFATPTGASSLSNGAWRRYSTVDGLPSNDVVSLLEDSDHNVWLGTALGLAVVRGSSVHAGLRLPASLRGPILGLAEDTAHWLWVSTADHVLHVDRGRLLDGTLADADVAEFGAADGLRGVEGVKRDRSLTMDARGPVWVSTSGGLAMADPTRVARWTAPALVTVEDVSVDGRSVGAADGVVIQPRRQRITFEFAGLSLSVPERVRYRYRLDGFDDDWSGPGSTRQAAYTNLGHGPYRFRVIASNGDGVWNSQEATLSFSIAPALWETTRFRVSAGLLLIAAVLAVHRLNVMRAVRKLNARFDERLAERTRIARDLHDTLLQTFHGVLFQFQAATNRLPDSDIKKQFEHSIDQAAQAITEGRDAVKNLRSSTIDATDLPTSISTLGRELASAVPSDDATANRPVVDVAVEGTPRDLHPVIRDDVYRIAAEALRNAFRHAHARRIEADIRYDDRHLTLRVRDDGKGMDPKILAEYRHGHFGLPGMRERAQVVGGHLDVWSQLGAGTEVELTIPAAAAYTAARTRDRWSFFTRKAGTSS